MARISDKLVEEAKAYVVDLLDRKLSEKLYYHNSKHALDVLSNAETIGGYYKLNQDDLNLLRFSAIFHDVGYIDQYKGHEEQSISYAIDFLQLQKINNSTIKQVIQAILATKMPQQPVDKISEILCDADLMYLSDKINYFKDSELLRREWYDLNIVKYSEFEFDNNSISFFENHLYNTDYGKKILQPKKDENLMVIRNRVLDHD